MAHDQCLAILTRNAIADAYAGRHDGGVLQLWTEPRPAKGDDAVPAGAVLLSEHRYGTPAYQPAENGTVVSYPIGRADAQVTGRVAWFRALDAAGRPVRDGAVGTEDANLIVADVDLIKGDPVLIRSSVLVCPDQIVEE